MRPWSGTRVSWLCSKLSVCSAVQCMSGSRPPVKRLFDRSSACSAVEFCSGSRPPVNWLWLTCCRPQKRGVTYRNSLDSFPATVGSIVCISQQNTCPSHGWLRTARGQLIMQQPQRHSSQIVAQRSCHLVAGIDCALATRQSAEDSFSSYVTPATQGRGGLSTYFSSNVRYSISRCPILRWSINSERHPSFSGPKPFRKRNCLHNASYEPSHPEASHLRAATYMYGKNRSGAATVTVSCHGQSLQG